LIDQWKMTAVNVHDRRMLESVLAAKPAGDSQLWVDSGYRSQELVKALRERGYKPRIVFKAQRGTKLNARQVQLNPAYSLSRARVEHVFGSMHNDMPESVMRCVGKVRAQSWVGLRNLCYNIKRYCYLATVTEV